MFLKYNGEGSFETNVLTQDEYKTHKLYKTESFHAKRDLKKDIKTNYLSERECKKLKVDVTKLTKKVYDGKNYYSRIDVANSL